jgi:Kdo2-lipid IVA lauroyltransferase/acyltransferase
VKRKSPLQASKNALIFAALRLASAVGGSLRLDLARTIGARLGNLANRLLDRERTKTIRHLGIAFPDLSENDRAAIAREMFRHLGRSLLEICWMRNLDAEALPATTTIEGIENMQRALEGGRGVVLFTGHCGNWEWMAAAIGLSGLPMNVIARELYDPRLNEFIVASRARHRIKTIGRGSGSSAREMLQTLRRNEILGVLIDQSIEAENADVDFFGRPAPTPIGPARLAIRAGAAVICGFIERENDRQRIRFEEPIFPRRDDEPATLTRAITSRIEEQIRRAPAQWVWMHDRWKPRKNRDLGEASIDS